MVSKDEDGDINVSILSANPAVDIKTLKLPAGATGATAVPYDAATHGRDYWLSPGAPHCADCHAAPYVEGQGGGAFPINQPGKYSNMRYSKGHSGLACQSCHQSIHGLYPVTATTDVTTINSLHSTIRMDRMARSSVLLAMKQMQGRRTEYRRQERACVEWQTHPE